LAAIIRSETKARKMFLARVFYQRARHSEDSDLITAP